jgi:hypothetical protein
MKANTKPFFHVKRIHSFHYEQIVETQTGRNLQKL